MIKIAFFNNKGGCGKSVATINVAHAMAKMGKRVLVADCDKQRNSFRFFADNGKEDYYGTTRYKGIDIVCDRIPLCDGYDYVIHDLPTGLSERTEEIISSCDYVFVPIELGTFAISGIANVTETIVVSDTRFGGCFVNRFDRNNPSDHELDKMLRQNLGEKVMTTMIPNSRTIKNSVSYRQTAIEYMWWIPATKAYTTLAHEIMRICENQSCREESE